MRKTEFLKKIKSEKVIVHITKDLNHNGYFYPRIPKNRLIGGIEDSNTNRICCAEDINGCLTSLSCCNTGLFKVFLIDVDKYNIRNNVIFSQELYKKNLVEDAYITKECWITTEINVLEEDTYIIAITELDTEDTEYLIPYEIFKESKEKNIDSIDLYREKYEYEPTVCSIISIFDDNSLDIVDKDFLLKLLDIIEFIEDEDMFDESEMDEMYDIIEKYDIKLLGEGSSRKVYSFLDMVVKLPITEDGEIQNNTECSIFNREKDSLNIINPSYEIGNLGMLFQNKLNPLNQSNSTNENILDYINNNKNIFSETQIKQIQNEIEYLTKEYDLLREDLIKLDSWGFVKGYYGVRKEIKLFDYGITNDVYAKYYDVL